MNLYEGIVIEECKEFLIVLTKNSNFVRIHKRNVRIRQGEIIAFSTYDLYDKKRGLVDFFKLRVALVAVLIVILCLPQVYSRDAYAYVSLDNKSSMEFIVSEDMKILDIIPRNERAKQHLKYLKEWKYENFNIVVEEILKQCKEEGVLTPHEDILIATSLYDKSGDLRVVRNKVDSVLSEVAQREEVNVVSFEVAHDVYKKAQEENISFGRFGVLIHSELLHKHGSYTNLEKLSEEDIQKSPLLDGDLKKIKDKRITESCYEKWSLNNRN
ncbi:hypothetical protein U8V72_23330 [Priestia filamentosa]|uniref:anti-sigma-I factor RsgI family protein n=1 Tax=Priestia filamentosa TaxID=1402861 RepID=UPI003977F1C0